MKPSPVRPAAAAAAEAASAAAAADVAGSDRSFNLAVKSDSYARADARVG
jgi:hypothetical protein